MTYMNDKNACICGVFLNDKDRCICYVLTWVIETCIGRTYTSDRDIRKGNDCMKDKVIGI